jgi:hypothetical protein
MKNGFAVILLASVLVSLSLLAAPPVSELNTKMQFPEPLPIERTSHNVHNTFFSKLQLLCGKTFSGQLVADTSQSERFAGQKLLMHVRTCNENTIYIPFHVGEDHSRTWIISRTPFGLGLKHDHRNPDGTHSNLTMYGGITHTMGSEFRQDFPVDGFSQQLLLELGYPQSITNVWSFFVYPESVSYQLSREGFVFRVKFDTQNEVETAPTPWGYKELN